MLDGLGEVAPSDLVEVLEEGFEYPNDDRESREDEELGAGIFNAEFGEERILLCNDNIDRRSDEQGRGEVEEFVEDGVEGCQNHRAAVRGGVVPEAGEGVFIHGVFLPQRAGRGTKFTKIERGKL